MNKFFWSMIILAAIPMFFLDSLGRDAFLGYYLGLITMWVVAVFGTRQVRSEAPTPLGDTNP